MGTRQVTDEGETAARMYAQHYLGNSNLGTTILYLATVPDPLEEVNRMLETELDAAELLDLQLKVEGQLN